ncbi:protein Lilipod isoform X2 [Parasteatoda tepidariorum]|uniref:protein Lilipod isoform X2 n=1 Tax=Parasteatoda tepidariorum TaxID=114398 RepID=UPI00077FD09B|nr:protein Lilipod isoform X2 [Parasteatoda tepidariorum]
MEDQDHEEWKAFHEKTREIIVFLLLFLSLYFASYCFILLFRKRKNDLFSGTYEDAIAYRISLWISTFSFTISIGAALLHPISIVTNEILLRYPNSYYVQWLNSSLIQGLWSLVFLFSNVALFLLLPFAHLFVESEGLPGSSRGIMSRVNEVLLVLGLMGLLVMGFTYIMSAILSDGQYSIASIFNFSTYYLPFLYSCVSFLGVLMLLICTPVGFARLFTVMSDVIVQPKLTPVSRYLKSFVKPQVLFMANDEAVRNSVFQLNQVYKRSNLSRNEDNGIDVSREETKNLLKFLHGSESLNWTMKKSFIYPIVMLILVSLTALSVLIVFQNILELCFGIKSLPTSPKNITLGATSLSTFGPFGALVEVILILYLWSASIVGLYSLPLFHYLRPQIYNTSMTQIMGNCALLLVLSSALPVLARSIGLTDFDLMGDFGRINWLGNFYIVLFHNVVFSVTAILCLGTQITAAVRAELYNRVRKICPMMSPCP